jgi:hypothetical protein
LHSALSPSHELAQAAYPLRWALAYAALGARVFPCRADKTPLTPRGCKDASSDPAIIQAWWARWPYADIGLAVANSFVVVDIDRKAGLGDGYNDFLELEGREASSVPTPTATTPSGGLHLYYRTSGAKYRNVVRVNGFAVDVRSVGGYVIAPGPGNGRQWIRSPRGPWAPVPAWLSGRTRDEAGPKTRCKEAVKSAIAADLADTLTALRPNGRYCGDTPYGRATLTGACTDICSAPNGEQETTLNRTCFKIGLLIGTGELGPRAEAEVLEAAFAMQSYDLRRPWLRAEIEAKVRRAIADGMRLPWTPDA